MKDSSNAPQIFAFAVMVFVLSIYVVSLQLRRRKYKRIADELGADHKARGLFGSGEITGSSNGRKYVISTREGHRATWTAFSVDCVNKGLLLSLHGKFFKPFPNWKFAFAKSERKRPQGLALVVDYPNVPVPLEEKYRAQVQSLFQEIALLDSKLLGKWRNTIDIDQAALSFTTHGVLQDAATAGEIISLLARVADRVESQPVS
jgi:hypothetical protein